MMHPMDGDDALSLSMFWAGLLMVFTPLIFAGTVIGVAWRHRVRLRRSRQMTVVSGADSRQWELSADSQTGHAEARPSP